MTLKCSRCGAEVPRQTTAQTRCVPCEAEVNDLIRRDTERRNRFAKAKDLTRPLG